MANNERERIDRFANRGGGDGPPAPGSLASHLRAANDTEAGKASITIANVLDIRPDIRQPRRALPAVVRGGFTGDPHQIYDILEAWRKLVVERAQQAIEVPRYIFATVEAPDVDTDDPIVTRFIALLRLAADIHANGLIHFPNVAEHKSGYILESGERRLLAHHLLMAHVDREQYSKINVVVKDRASVWTQATENTASESYGPIEKARQLALLLMDMWEGDRDFKPIEDCITVAGSDRPYYAQALDLNSRRGQGQRLLNAMGVSARGTVTKYKKLLELSDEAWLRAEAENLVLNELLAIIDEEQGTGYHVTSNVSNGNISEAEASPSVPTAQERPKRLNDPDSVKNPKHPWRHLSEGDVVFTSHGQWYQVTEREFSGLVYKVITVEGAATSIPVEGIAGVNDQTWGQVQDNYTGDMDTDQMNEAVARHLIRQAGGPERVQVVRDGDVVEVDPARIQPGDVLAGGGSAVETGDLIAYQGHQGKVVEVGPQSCLVEFADGERATIMASEWDEFEFLDDVDDPLDGPVLSGEPLIIDDHAVFMLWAAEPFGRGIRMPEGVERFQRAREALLDASPASLHAMKEQGITAETFEGEARHFVQALRGVFDRWVEALETEIDETVIPAYRDIEAGE